MMSRVWKVVRAAAAGYHKDRCSHMAAAIAYRTLFSIVPVVALLAGGLGWILKIPNVERAVLARVLERLPLHAGPVADAIETLGQSRESLTVVGLVMLMWAGAGLFGALRDSLNVVWGVERERGFVTRKLMDLVALLVLGVLMAISVLGTATLYALHRASTVWWGGMRDLVDTAADAAGWLFPAGLTFLAFLLVYRHIPGTPRAYREVWHGALIAAILFEAAKHGFALYAAYFSRYEVLFGALGTVMLFMLWVFLSASILLAGAEMAVAIERARAPTPPGEA